MEKLTKRKFSDALKKGLGRAFLHVSKYGLKDVADLVLNACLHNQNYDTQCEPSRARWLFRMIHDKPEYPAFQKAILRSLETGTNEADLFQLSHFAGEMAQNGDKVAKRILRKCVLNYAKNPELDGSGTSILIEVYGNTAVLDLAKIYGKRLLKNPDMKIWYGFYCDKDIQKLLSDNSSSDLRIKAFWDYLIKSGDLKFQNSKELTQKQIKLNKQKRRREFRTKYPLKKIIEDAQNGIGVNAENYVRFGVFATARELGKIYDLILKEPDNDVRMRLLWIFRRTSLPKYSKKFFDWANGKHKRLRSASIAALAQVSNEKVHTLARAKVKSNQITDADNEAIDLFINNYKSRDAIYIIQALFSVKPNPDDTHALSHSIRELTDIHKDLQLTNALAWVYENTPCTLCREDIVKKLSEFGGLNNSILRECLYDANEDTVAVARNLSEQVG
jgi:hypothetical protein